MRARIALAVAAVGLVALVAGWSVHRSRVVVDVDLPDSATPEPLMEGQIVAPLVEGAGDEPRGGILNPDQDRAEMTGRVEANAVRVLSGLVTDEENRPIDAAEVALVPLVGDLSPETWLDRDWNALERATVIGVTGPGGAFRLELPDEWGSSHRACIWVTKPGWMGDARILADLGAPGPLEFRLTEAPAHEVRVLDELGLPASDADVLQFGMAFIPFERHLAGALAPAVEVFQQRRHAPLTDALRLGAIPGRTAIVARRGDQVSWPSIVESPGQVLTLNLGGSFVLQGRVLAPVGSDAGPPRVNVTTVTDAGEDWIGGPSVRPDGSFGPLTMPHVRDAAYAFMLVGGDYISERLERPAVAAGELVDLVFEGRKGVTVRVLAQDPDNMPIAGALIRTRWRSAFGAVELFASSVYTDEAGWATVHGCPPVGAWFEGQADGFSSAETSPFTFIDGEEFSVEITLLPTARIEGVVVNNDAPVEAFNLTWWTTDLTRTTSRRFESPQGRFLIEGIPAVTTNLFAWSEVYPRSRVLTVPLGEQHRQNLRIELHAPRLGRGTVVDADERTPVEGASVQAVSNHLNSYVGFWGVPALTDHLGRFEMEAFPEDLSYIWVNATGYQGSMALARPDSEGTIDFGMVPLYPERTLEVRLVSMEPRDYARYHLAAYDGIALDPSPFSSDGTYQVPGARAGHYLFEIKHPNGLSDFLDCFVRPGDPWSIVHDLDGAGTAVLIPRLAPDCELPDPWPWEIRYRNASGIAVARVGPWGAGLEGCPISEMPAGQTEIVVGNLEHGPAGSRVVSPDASVHREITVDVACGTRALRIEDWEGVPQAGTSIYAWDMDESPPAPLRRTTDSEGVLGLALGVGPRVGLSMYGSMTYLGVIVDLLDPPPPVQVVRLEEPAELRIRLLDGSDPLEGISCWVEENSSRMTMNLRTSNADGIATWELVAPASYTVILGAQGLWRTAATVRSGPEGGDPVPIQVRRVGALEIAVTTGGGKPLAGFPVELTSEEFQEDVSDWLEVGKIDVPGGSLATDEAGTLLLTGLPNGPYRWRATTPEGATKSGEVTVPAAATGSLAISMP